MKCLCVLQLWLLSGKTCVSPPFLVREYFLCRNRAILLLWELSYLWSAPCSQYPYEGNFLLCPNPGTFCMVVSSGLNFSPLPAPWWTWKATKYRLHWHNHKFIWDNKQFLKLSNKKLLNVVRQFSTALALSHRKIIINAFKRCFLLAWETKHPDYICFNPQTIVTVFSEMNVLQFLHHSIQT